MQCEISVIVPVYQVEDYIMHSITSIAQQSFRNFEVVIVNDGSKDSSVAIAENILSAYNVNYVVINQENKGQASARNTGIINSSGKWIVCVDSDDVVHRDFLRLLYLAAKEHDTDVSFCDFQFVTIDKILKTPALYTEESGVLSQKEIMFKFLKREVKIVPAMLIKRELIDKQGIFFNENALFSEDLHFIWRILLSVDRVAYNKSTLYNYLRRPNSTMTSSSVERIMTGYREFINLVGRESMWNGYDEIRKFVIPRWVLGVLRSSSRYMNIEDFELLATSLNYKENMKALFEFPELKAKILSYLMYFSPKLFYKINRLFT
ncbi:MAG: glycosyltransferase family 2 protein [Fervidobacterium sp.]|uniref:glycosyltransferase family 2 protein n=1 Tax=Fervidobacterium sp. TaxID=1871331 RepID=UPI00404A0678